ncbi:LuxR C-terminal-related transcriptional regulator [Frankia sp. CiP3]|uniref:LuxR C-terminal-related transcriptional regulator n=1 Tax=Frankia sp. CiP3 TaxID=2880971 RepID=UPI001EF54122|nr:LuxR C-terminal-related transcriptional regulator [Frankia sp. CiP3]
MVIPAQGAGRPPTAASGPGRSTPSWPATSTPWSVGRQGLLAYFDDLVLRAARTGRGSGYLLSGERGIGKSHLARIFTHRAEQKGMVTFRGRCVPGGSPLRSLRESLLRVGSKLPDAVEFEQCTPAEVVAEQLIVRWTSRPGEPAALVVVEDLHHADPRTQEVLFYISDHLDEVPLILVGTAQSPARLEWPMVEEICGNLNYLDGIIPPLAPAEVEELVRHRIPAPDPQVIDFLRRWSDGVPLHLLDLLDCVHDLATAITADGDVIATGGDGTAMATVSDLFTAQVPRPLASRVLLRMAGLDDHDRQALRVMSLLGPTFGADAVERITRLPAGMTERSINRLVELDIVQACPLADRDGFGFRHALVGEVIRRTMSPDQVRSLGRAAAELLRDQARHEAETDLSLARRKLQRAAAILAPGSPEHTEVLTEQLDIVSRIGDAGAERALLFFLRPSVQAPGTSAGPGRCGPGGLVDSVDQVRVLLRAAATALTLADDLTARRLALRALRAALDLALPALVCEALDVLGCAAERHDIAATRRAYTRLARVAALHRMTYWDIHARAGTAVVRMLTTADTRELRTVRELADQTGLRALTTRLEIRLAQALLLSGNGDEAKVWAESAGLEARRLSLPHLLGQAQGLLRLVRMVESERSGADRGIDGDHTLVDAMEALAANNMVSLARVLDTQAEAGVFPEAHVPFCWSGLRRLAHALEGTTAPADPLLSTADRGLGAFGLAVVTGRTGDRAQAELRACEAVRLLRGFDWCRHQGQLAVAEAAADAGWGAPAEWLQEAIAYFGSCGHPRLVQQARQSLRRIGAPVPRRGRGATTVPYALARVGVTTREMDVLELVARGLSNQLVADRLVLSTRTVESHLRNLLTKTGCQNRADLARFRHAGTDLPATEPSGTTNMNGPLNGTAVQGSDVA